MSREHTTHGSESRSSARIDKPRVGHLSSGSKLSRLDSDTIELSRATGTEYYAAKRKREKRKRIGKRILATVLSLVLVSGVAVALYLSHLSSRLNAGVDDNLRKALTQTEAGDPFYMLLLGVDKSEERANSKKYGKSYHNYRADTIILARVDPKTPKLTLVSIHRDTLVDLGKHGKQKINASYAIGGPSYTTEVVSKFAGVPISHYAEIDFDGFMSVIDVLGGVEVNIPVEVKDERYAGGHLMPGVQTLSAKDALFLCRARHAYDKYGDGDAYRAANQRNVIAAIVKKILASNPATMANVISECAGYVTTDMDITSIIGLAAQMRGLDTNNDIYSGMDPTVSKYVNRTWYEICDTAKWKAMMKRVNEGLPPNANPKDDPTLGVAAGANTDTASSASKSESQVSEEFGGSVKVLNASGKSGVAAKLAQILTGAGFSAIADNAPSSQQKCLVIYNKSAQGKAKAAQSKLGGVFEIVENDGSWPTDTDVVVIIGSSYKG